MKEEIKKGNFEWKNGLDSTITFKANKEGKFNIKFYKPNFIERILIWLKIIKDKMYDGKKISWQEMDEIGVMGSHNIAKRLEVNKRYIAGFDPFETKKQLCA